MAGQVLREEIWESERFLELPSDTHRLAFIRCLNLSDDFGNFEGGSKRLFRKLHECTQLKSETGSRALLADLIECDLLRRYEIEGRELFHIPRFSTCKSYLARRVPPSPWCDTNVVLGKTKRVVNRGLAKNAPVTSPAHNKDVSTEVGVGVGVGEKKTPSVSKKPPQSGAPPADAGTDAGALVTTKDLVAEGVDAKHARDWLKVRRSKKAPLTETAWERVKAEAVKAGLSIADAVKFSAERGWQGFMASWYEKNKPPAADSALADLFARGRS